MSKCLNFNAVEMEHFDYAGNKDFNVLFYTDTFQNAIIYKIILYSNYFIQTEMHMYFYVNIYMYAHICIILYL